MTHDPPVPTHRPADHDRRRRRPAVASLVLWTAATLLVVAPVAADRLVTVDGAVIETRGSWEVRGKSVVFTTASGTLSSMRASEIDFEATEVANQPPAEPAETTEAPPPAPPALVLTDKDIRRGASAPTTEAAEADAVEPAELETAAPATEDGANDPNAGESSVFVPASGLALRSWSVRDTGQIDGLEIVGTVINRGSVVVVDVGVRMRFEGRDGEETREAFVGSPTLGPGRATDFRIPLPDQVSAPDEPTFDVLGRGLKPRVLGGVEDVDEDGEPVSDEALDDDPAPEFEGGAEGL